MDAKERKYRSILKNSGYAVIAFGLWGMIRILLMKFLDPESYDSLFGITEAAPELQHAYTVVSLVMMLFVLGLDLLFRVYVGSSAIKEGNGGKKRIVYVIAAVLYLALSLRSDIGFLIEYSRSDSSFNMLVLTLVDISFCSAFFAIIYSALRLRQVLRRKAGEKA